MRSLTNYSESRPGPQLAGNIVGFWHQYVDAANANFLQPVLPNGCMTILWHNDGSPMLMGPMTRHRAGVLEDGLQLSGIRLFPGQASALFGLPAREIADSGIPLHELLGNKKHSEPLSSLHKPLREIRAELNERVLRLFSESRFAGHDLQLAAGVRWLARFPNGSIKELARHIELSERQVQRRFYAAVGFSPKFFQRILRFQRFLTLIRKPAAPSLALLAIDAGFADQAHLNRECREFSGHSPLELIKDSHSSLAMSDLFNTH